MTKKQDEAIARGMVIAGEIDEEDGREIARDVVQKAEAAKLPIQPQPRTRKTFDHTGVQPPVVEPKEIHEISTAGVAQPPTVSVTLTRALTMGSTMHPSGATVVVPIVYGDMLVKSGAAVVAAEQERPEEPEPEPEPEPEGETQSVKRRTQREAAEPDEDV